MKLKFIRYYSELPSEELPMKKGIHRFFEIVFHRFAQFWGMSALVLLTVLPGCAVFVWFCTTMPLFSIIGGGLAGAMGGPLYLGLCKIIWCAINSEPGYIGPILKEYLRCNAKKDSIRGAIAGALLSMIILAGIMMFININEMLLFFGTVCVELVVWTCIVNSYIILQINGYVGINPLKKACSTFMKNPYKMMLNAIIEIVYWIFIVFFFPYSAFVYILTGFWLPTAISLYLARSKETKD